MRRWRFWNRSSSWCAVPALRSAPSQPTRAGRKQVPRTRRPARPARAMPGRPDFPANRALAWLYCPPAQRRLLAALCALEGQIGASLAAGLDHQLAHTRLAWWREECARCAQGRPSHPITRELAELLAPIDAHSLEGLCGFVDTATWDLAAASFATRRELSGYCERWSAAMIEPLARLAEPTLAPGQARSLGARLSWLDRPGSRASAHSSRIDTAHCAPHSLPAWPNSRRRHRRRCAA